MASEKILAPYYYHSGIKASVYRRLFLCFLTLKKMQLLQTLIENILRKEDTMLILKFIFLKGF